MAQHHAVRVAPLGQGDDGGDAIGGGVVHVDPEAVHAKDEAGVGQGHQVVEVIAVAGVADDDLGEVDAFLGEDGVHPPSGFLRRRGVHGQGCAGFAVRRRIGPQDPVGGLAPQPCHQAPPTCTHCMAGRAA